MCWVNKSTQVRYILYLSGGECRETGAGSNWGRDVHGRRVKRGRETRYPRGQELEEIGKHNWQYSAIFTDSKSMYGWDYRGKRNGSRRYGKGEMHLPTSAPPALQE